MIRGSDVSYRPPVPSPPITGGRGPAVPSDGTFVSILPGDQGPVDDEPSFEVDSAGGPETVPAGAFDGVFVTRTASVGVSAPADRASGSVATGSSYTGSS